VPALPRSPDSKSKKLVPRFALLVVPSSALRYLSPTDCPLQGCTKPRSGPSRNVKLKRPERSIHRIGAASSEALFVRVFSLPTLFSGQGGRASRAIESSRFSPCGLLRAWPGTFPKDLASRAQLTLHHFARSDLRSLGDLFGEGSALFLMTNLFAKSAPFPLTSFANPPVQLPEHGFKSCPDVLEVFELSCEVGLSLTWPIFYLVFQEGTL